MVKRIITESVKIPNERQHIYIYMVPYTHILPRKEAVLHTIFIDLQKTYDFLDWDR